MTTIQPSHAQIKQFRPKSPRWPLRLLKFSIISLISILLLLTVLLLGASIGYLMVKNSDYIMNGVRVGELDVGNLTQAQASALLAADGAVPLLSVGLGDESFQIDATELGVALDIPRLVETAYAQGRSADNSLIGTLDALTLDVQITPSFTLDWAQAENALSNLAPEIFVAPTNAALQVDGTQAVAIAGQNGRELDVQSTIQQWQSDFAGRMATGQFALVTVPLTPDFADATQFATEANAILNQPLQLDLFDPIRNTTNLVAVEQNDWASWLQFDVADNQLTLTTNRDAIADTLAQTGAALAGTTFTTGAPDAIQQAIAIGQDTVSLRQYHPTTTHLVAAGETLSSIGRNYGIPYPWIQAANPDVTTLLVGQSIIIPSPDELVPLPIVRNKRIVVSISDQHMIAYENGQVAWDQPISTGIDESPTTPGVFQIQTHEENAYAGNWDLHMPYFMGIYQPAPNINFMNGFHGFPTRDGNNLLWTNSLGEQATFGCVLIDNAIALDFYTWAENGVIVEVTP